MNRKRLLTRARLNTHCVSLAVCAFGLAALPRSEMQAQSNPLEYKLTVKESMLSASSTYGGNTPITSFTGDLSENHGWCATAGDQNAWIAVDFSANSRVTRVRVMPDRYIATDTSYSYMDSFEVQTWQAGAWSSASALVLTPEEIWYQVNLNTNTSKIRIIGHTGGTSVQIKQIEVYQAIAPAVIPMVTNSTTSVYAAVPGPVRLSFAPDGRLFVGRDPSLSGGGTSEAVKIHCVSLGGWPVSEYGDTAISDPDAVFYDTTGQFSGTAGAVIVGGVEAGKATGKLSKISPDLAVSVFHGPTVSAFNPCLFVDDQTGGRLLISDDYGTVWTMTNSIPTALFSLPAALPLAVDALGRIVAGTETDTSLRLYSSSGILLNSSFAQGNATAAIARGSGRLWGSDIYCVASGGTLVRISTNGLATRIGSGFSGVIGLAFGLDDALYASGWSDGVVWRITAPNPQPVLSAAPNGANLALAWDSLPGRQYHVLTTTSLVSPTWVTNATVSGTGSRLTNSVPIGSEPARFFRLLVVPD